MRGDRLPFFLTPFIKPRPQFPYFAIVKHITTAYAPHISFFFDIFRQIFFFLDPIICK